MLLILSVEGDTSTNHVIDWLIHYDVKFIRINGEDKFSLYKFELSNNDFICSLINCKTQEIIDLAAISSIWYRRGDINFFDKLNIVEDLFDIKKYMDDEYSVLHDFIIYYLESKPKIDGFRTSVVNKLKVLKIAKEIGLSIPITLIFQGSFPDNIYGDYITKSLSEVYRTETIDNGYYYTPTTLIDPKSERLKGLCYSLSKLQNHIEKECDVRVFYIKGNFYSMAIMSQNNEKSTVDFRHYPSDPPNRSFPVKLPENVENMLDSLMVKLLLDSGSIDLILDKYGNFIFLEINPVGQFGMTSLPCNYYLQKKIALKLSKLAI